MTTAHDPEREARIDELVLAYRLAQDAGTTPRLTDFLRQHPEYAEELRGQLEPDAALRAVAGDEDWDPLPLQPHAITYCGEYQVQARIGAGAFGVVYRVWNRREGRCEALKMIRRDKLSSRDAVRRFLAEGRTLERLKHPHIVEIYAVDEWQGHPYYTMKLIEGREGGSLEALLRPGPNGQPTRFETVRKSRLEWEKWQRWCATLLVQVARAVQHAHDRAILHRDLKPANILLDGADTPCVSDFGLARFLNGEETISLGEALVGTPAYMAPEQAAGAKDLTTAVDVYSLGAILYQLFTGRRPFEGYGVQDVLDQVKDSTRTPPAPRQLNALVARDLETICLKCLEKEPEKRYRSAAELADELERWLRGEPIQARPVGRLERAWRWCRRNPAVAALSTTAVLLLVLGLTVAWGLTLWAWDEAERADKVAIVAGNNADRAREEQKKAEDARKKTDVLADQLLDQLARTMLYPLGLQAQDGHSAPLIPMEMKVLSDLASYQATEVGERLVLAALQEPATLRQLRLRANYALQAALGLNAERRQRVEDLLVTRLRGPETSSAERLDLALMLHELGDCQRATNRLVAEVLAKQLTWGGGRALKERALKLNEVAARLEEKEAARLRTEAARLICSWIERVPGGASVPELADTLAALVVHLDAKTVHSVWFDQMWFPLLRNDLWDRPQEFARCLLVLAGQFDSTAAKEVLPLIVEHVSRSMSSTERLPPLIRVAETLLDRVKDEDVEVLTTKATTVSLQALDHTLGVLQNYRWQNREWSELSGEFLTGLTNLTSRLRADEAARINGKAAQLLVSYLDKITDPNGLHILTKCLVSLAPHLATEEATRVGGAVGVRLAQILVRIKRVLPNPPSPPDCLPSADETVENRPQPLPETVSVREPDVAVNQLATAIALVANYLSAKEAEVVTTLIVRRLNENENKYFWGPVPPRELAHTLAKIATRLPVKTANKIGYEVAKYLLPRIDNWGGGVFTENYQKECIEGVAALIPVLEARASVAILTPLLQERQGWTWEAGARILVWNAARFNAREAANLMVKALQLRAVRLGSPTVIYQSTEFEDLAAAISRVAIRLDTQEAKPFCRQTATLICELIQKRGEGDPMSVRLMRPLADLAPWLDRQEASPLGRLLNTALQRLANPVAESPVSQRQVKLASQSESDLLHRQTLSELKEEINSVRDSARQAKLFAWFAQRDTNQIAPFCGVCATVVMQQMAQTDSYSSQSHLTMQLRGFLAREYTPGPVRPQSVAGSLAALTASRNALLTPALLQPALAPLPAPLPVSTLVKLLNQPFCVGVARRAVLDQLQRHYQRPFADQWDFVRFAHERNLKLDFTTPPRQLD